jgi:hypothetical protein
MLPSGDWKVHREFFFTDIEWLPGQEFSTEASYAKSQNPAPWHAPVTPSYVREGGDGDGKMVVPGQLGQKSLREPISMEKSWTL